MGDLFGGTIAVWSELASSQIGVPPLLHRLAESESGVATATLLATALSDLTPMQKIGFFLGMMILVYTVVRMGIKRRMATASGQPSPRPSVGNTARRALFTSYTGGGPGRSMQHDEDDDDRRPTGTRPLSGVRGGSELEALVVNLREVGREIEARLDTKIRFAQRLLEEAEISLTNLEVARARAENTARDPHAAHRANLAAAESSLASADPEFSRTTTEDMRALREAREPRQETSFFAPSEDGDDHGEGDGDDDFADGDGDGDISEGDPQLRRGETQADALEAMKRAERDVPPRGPATPETSSQQRVRELAAEGKGAREIAMAVGRPVGEIELILALGRGSDSSKSP